MGMGAVQQVPIASAGAKEAVRPVGIPRALAILTVITVLAVAGGLYMALGYAGTELTQGEVQRLFYIHVPAFSGAFVAFVGTVIGGVMYLRTRQTKWDILALAGVEVGLMLALVNLTLGMIWARPIWNTWWTWDSRLTSAAIMVLTYTAYLMLRNGIENPERRRRFASIYGILAITTVILTLMITRIVPSTIHPVVFGPSPQGAEGTFDLKARYGVTVAINSLIWCSVVPITLMWYRIRLENFAERINALKARWMEQ
jgi:heme exporter protein C